MASMFVCVVENKQWIRGGCGEREGRGWGYVPQRRNSFLYNPSKWIYYSDFSEFNAVPFPSPLPGESLRQDDWGGGGELKFFQQSMLDFPDILANCTDSFSFSKYFWGFFGLFHVFPQFQVNGPSPHLMQIKSPVSLHYKVTRWGIFNFATLARITHLWMHRNSQM